MKHGKFTLSALSALAQAACLAGCSVFFDP